MEIVGKIIQFLPVQTGEGKNGPWKKQDFILETQEQYPKKVCISVWGEKINITQYQINDVIKAQINVESREFNERWYTDVRAWRVEAMTEASAQPPMADGAPVPPPPPADSLEESNDDLPF